MLGKCPVKCPLNRVKITGHQRRTRSNVRAGPPFTTTLDLGIFAISLDFLNIAVMLYLRHGLEDRVLQ